MNLLPKGTLTGTGQPYDLVDKGNCHTCYATWAADATTGVVVIETAAYYEYAGTWTTIGTFNVNAGVVDLTNFQHIPLAAIRARVTTSVNGAGVQIDIVTS